MMAAAHMHGRGKWQPGGSSAGTRTDLKENTGGENLFRTFCYLFESSSISFMSVL